ncbi:MAG: ribbon-helix-helix protein, CopG family [Blastocatellia bacterium]
MSLHSEPVEITGLPPDMLKALDDRAQQTGRSREEYIRQLIEKDLAGPVSLRDLYAPVREQIAESGITDDELDALIEAVREEIWQERQGQHHSE